MKLNLSSKNKRISEAIDPVIEEAKEYTAYHERIIKPKYSYLLFEMISNPGRVYPFFVGIRPESYKEFPFFLNELHKKGVRNYDTIHNDTGRDISVDLILSLRTIRTAILVGLTYDSDALSDREMCYKLVEVAEDVKIYTLT